MSGYGQIGNYYDPVGSQPHQPQGYTYQQIPTTSTHPNQVSENYQAYNNQFANQQYSNAHQQTQQAQQTQRQQHPSSSTSLAAAALSSLSTQDYSQANVVNNRSGNVTSQLGINWANQPYGQSSYSSGQPAATFGQLSLPEQSSTPTSAFRATTTQAYPSSTSFPKLPTPLPTTAADVSTSSRSYASQSRTPQPPQRYASPLHAVQAQQQYQSGNRPKSRNDANHRSPHLTAQHLLHQNNSSKQSDHQLGEGSANSQATVDPTLVYDFRAEQQRKARIEAEKRRKREEEEALRKAEEDMLASEQLAREAESARVEAERQKMQSDAQAAKAATEARNTAAKAKREQARKAKEEKAKQKEAMNNTLATASEGNGEPVDEEEAQMRAMFRKMREFNQKNPAMLAKLWDEERKAHTESSPRAPIAQSTESASTSLPPSAPVSGAPVATASKPPRSFATGSTTPGQGSPAPAPLSKRPSVSKKAEKAMTTAPQTSGKSPSIPQQPVSTLWPSHKKGSLAEAASNWLNQLPANRTAGKSTSKQEIFKMVDGNPSYVQLCELIEKTGIRFERSAFARELLKTLPDAARQVATKPSSNGPSASLPTTPATTPGYRPLGGPGVPYQVPPHAVVDQSTPSAAPPPFAQGTSSAFSSQPQSAGAFAQKSVVSLPPAGVVEGPVQTAAPLEPKPEPQPWPPPANKEEAARKRTFNDLVDLTNDDSDDEGPPRKMLQTFVPSPLPQQEHFSKPTSFQSFMFSNQRNIPGPSAAGHAHSHHLPVVNALPSSFPHPPPVVSQAPTPAINTQPSQDQLELERQQRNRMKGQMLVEPIMRDRVARKSKYDSRTIARDVLLATGRHPDMRPLNSHLNVMQKLLGDHGGMIGGGSGMGNRSDLSTIRWDIIDPGEASEEALRKSRKSVSRADLDEDLHEPEDDTEKHHADGSQRKSATKFGSNDPGTSQSEAKPKGARRGRPPKYSALETTSNGATPSQLPAIAQQPTTMPPGTPVGYAAFAQTTVDASGNTVKKKGRPVGWRKSIHSREARGLSPATKKAATGNPQSKPKSDATRTEQLQVPHYQVYACGWAQCQAELHNLDTLKKHVVKLHGAPGSDGRYKCAWRACQPPSVPVVGSDDHDRSLDGPPQFDSIEPWLQHIDKAHLQPIAWELGDGPGLGEAGQ